MIFEPGSTIGVVGGGQLGRMFVLEARREGYRTVVYTDEPPGSPAGQMADLEINAPYHAGRAAAHFAEEVDVATYEFENIPGDFIEALEEKVPVRPGRRALVTCQHREREKSFLREQGLPCAPFEVVDSLAALKDAITRIGTPSILKTAAFGYDGKGQARIDDPAQAEDAWATLDYGRAVLEGYVDFRMEVSVVAARDMSGRFEAFPAVENEHRRHILATSIAPARVDEGIAARAVDLARRTAEALDYVGTLAVEFFVTDNDLLINEIAPRPHNSGHWTIDACSVSQFRQQLLAVTGRAVETPVCRAPAVMINLLGDIWPGADSEPDFQILERENDVHLHLYGKSRPRRGRKMGHFTAVGAPVGETLALARRLKDQLDLKGAY